MTTNDEPDVLSVCVICKDPATNIFWGKPLCDDHYELSRH